MMLLPPRTEGPHSWLWLLLYREAARDLPVSAEPAARTQAAGLLWDRVVAGSLSVRRDRSGLSEETDPWLPELVAVEARRHLALSAELDRAEDADPDQRAAKARRPSDERVNAISLFIWRQLGNGWARVVDGEDTILFWDPEASAFVPFSLDLNQRYVRRFGKAAAS